MFSQLRLSTAWEGTLWINPVERVFVCKQRPIEKSLLILIKKDWLLDFAVVEGKAENLIDKFWPGALTIVLPQKQSPDFLRDQETRSLFVILLLN